MKRFTRSIAFLLASLLLIGTLLSYKQNDTPATTTAPDTPTAPIEGRAGMTPSEIMEILPKVEWVVIEYTTSTDVQDLIHTYTKNGNKMYHQLYQHNHLNFTSAVGNEYMDFENKLHYFNPLGKSNWLTEPSSHTWWDWIDHIMEDEELRPAFNDQVYKPANKDGVADARLNSFPQTVQSAKFKSDNKTYTFTFETNSYQPEAVTLKIAFLKKNIDLPTDAKPKPETQPQPEPPMNVMQDGTR